jgi:hypothetical protein
MAVDWGSIRIKDQVKELQAELDEKKKAEKND